MCCYFIVFNGGFVVVWGCFCVFVRVIVSVVILCKGCRSLVKKLVGVGGFCFYFWVFGIIFFGDF